MTRPLQTFLDDFHAGLSAHAFTFLGAHPQEEKGQSGFVFRVWAPQAKEVSVVGDFNSWNPQGLPMHKLSHGIWEAWSSAPAPGQAYKYLITHWSGRTVCKTDPMAIRTCPQPDTSGIIDVLPDYPWQDGEFLARQAKTAPLCSPMNIYQMDLTGWKRKANGSLYSCQELALKLAAYLKVMGYTHVEFAPLCAFDTAPQQGYLISSYYAPDPRFGAAADLMELVDTLHQAGIGVILDWSCLHFRKNEHGLMDFDGTRLYEAEDPLKAEPEAWPTRSFDYAKPEVRSFLISNAVYWLEKYHLDGLRVDGVSSMLYRGCDQSSRHTGGEDSRQDLSAIAFLQDLNKACFALRPGILTIADECTAYPLVTRPDYDGGLGFLFNWNCGWKSDTLHYLQEEPALRRFHHELLTFPMTYGFNENYILPISHKESYPRSLMDKLPGDYFWKFAALRLLRGYQMTFPGKKLSFMGTEFGQFDPWSRERQLDWNLLRYDIHEKMQNFTRDLNELYLRCDQFWYNDLDWSGYHWVQSDDRENGVIAYLRMGKTQQPLLVVCSFCQELRDEYRMGVPQPGIYVPLFCSDDLKYGGGGYQTRPVLSQQTPFQEYGHSALFRIPPMSITIYARKSKL